MGEARAEEVGAVRIFKSCLKNDAGEAGPCKKKETETRDIYWTKEKINYSVPISP